MTNRGFFSIRNKKSVALALACIIGLSLCACGAEGFDGGKKDDDTEVTGGSKFDPIPDEAYEFWADEESVSPSYADAKYCAVSKGTPSGHWERTDRSLILSGQSTATKGDVTVTAELSDDQNGFDDGRFIYNGDGGENLIRFSTSFVSESYDPGEACNPSITLKYEEHKKNAPGKIYGAAYFADVSTGDDIFGQSVKVREYLVPERNYGSGYQIMRGFGKNTENRSGGHEEKDGSGETFVDPLGFMPVMVSEGDKVWLVVDMIDGETWQVGIRKLFEFTWVPDSDESAYDAVVEEEEEHDENSPEWIRRDYPGRWDLTDVIYTGSDEGTTEKTGVTATAERFGVDGQNMCFTFNGREKYYMPTSIFDKSYYAEGYFSEIVKIYPDPVSDNPAGEPRCIFLLADVERDSDGAITTFKPKHYFTQFLSDGPIKAFSPGPKGKEMKWREYEKKSDLNFEGSFPEGKADGEKIYLVYGARDSVTGDCSLYNVYEYTYTMGPITEWTYNPPGY